jgi:hypothetical protein
VCHTRLTNNKPKQTTTKKKMVEEKKENGEEIPTSTWWEGIDPRDESVLLVVQLDRLVKNANERLTWLEQNVFPSTVFNHRRLILYSGSALNSNFYKNVKEPWKWDVFPTWEAVYNYLCLPSQNHYSFRRGKNPLDFAIFLNVREDGDPGLGYGMRERRSERCILRATTLACGGNVLFGDWGWPAGCTPETTDEELREMYALPPYMYPKVNYRLYPGHWRNRAFIHMLNQFLTPIYADSPTLPDSTRTKVMEGVNRDLYTRSELRKAWWNAYWHLYFAEDGLVIRYHCWPWYLRNFHLSIIFNYIQVNAWIVSCTLREIASDLFALFLVMLLFTGARACLIYSLLSFDWNVDLDGVFSSGPFWYLLWFVVWHVMNKPKDIMQMDHIPTSTLFKHSLAEIPYLLSLEIGRIGTVLQVSILAGTVLFVGLLAPWFFLAFMADSFLSRERKRQYYGIFDIFIELTRTVGLSFFIVSLLVFSNTQWRIDCSSYCTSS